MTPIIFIVGPTATGKSETAFYLAKKLKAQIISCDSMLIYREPKIITSMPADSMLKEIKHHFVAFRSVEETYGVFDYYLAATKKIILLNKKKVPLIICGGSGLYVKALLEGIFKGAPTDLNLRKVLEDQAKLKGLGSLYRELKSVDPLAAAKISQNDQRRIIRAIEVYRLSGVPMSEKKKTAQGLWGKLDIKIFGLKRKREDLYNRINLRVDEMFDSGAVDEVKKLLKLNLSITSAKLLGIKEIKQYIDGQCSIDQAKIELKKNTRRFAKRQITWFKPDQRIEWLDADGKSTEQLSRELFDSLR